MSGADSSGLDPPGVPVALCPPAPYVSVQSATSKTLVQALSLQTGTKCSRCKNTDTHLNVLNVL